MTKADTEKPRLSLQEQKLIEMLILNKPKFQVGETAKLNDKAEHHLGTGEVVVTKTYKVPLKSLNNVGHSQWVEFSKLINGLQMVYDSYARCYVLPENLTDNGRAHPTTISGMLLDKIA